jgi:signal recognition particle subunit SRP54
MLPGMGIKTSDLEGAIDETQMKRTEAIVLSMTKEERRNPKILTPQRKHRIAKGAGKDLRDSPRIETNTGNPNVCERAAYHCIV